MKNGVIINGVEYKVKYANDSECDSPCKICDMKKKCYELYYGSTPCDLFKKKTKPELWTYFVKVKNNAR